MIVMKVAYHVDDDFDSDNSFGIVEIALADNSIELSDIRLKISKIVSDGKSFVFPNLITINKISILRADIIDSIEIDQPHSFFIRNITGQAPLIRHIKTTSASCSLISIHGFDLSNTHINVSSDLMKFDNAAGVFPSFNESRIGLISFVFQDIFHFKGEASPLLVNSSLIGKIHIQNMCVGSDDSFKQAFELISLKDGAVVEILNIQYVEFHDEHIRVEINLDKQSKLLNIEAEDDTKLKLQI